MHQLIFAALMIFMFETANADSRACSEVDLEQAHEAMRFNQATLCFLFTPISASAENSLSADPFGISLYVLGDRGAPTIVHELPDAGTAGKIQEAFLMPGNGTRDDKLIVIQSMEAPSSLDASGDIYAVSVFSLQDGNLLHDYKASRYFDMGADMENGHELRAFIYPYKTRAQIENAWRSRAFQAIHASSSIDGAIKKKTFLYDGDAEPILQATGKSYLIKGDVVKVRDSVAGWCKASYNTGKRALIKWVDCSSIKFLEEKHGYAACIDGAGGVHVEMTTCIRDEIDRINIIIENHLTTAGQEQSIKELWEALSESTKIWFNSMNASCNIYQVMGGQRAELLNKICILEEVKFRESFIKSILIEAQI